MTILCFLSFFIEVMGALVSVLIIWVLTGILVYEAVIRVKNPDYTINPVVMLITSGAGVVVNIMYVCFIFSQVEFLARAGAQLK